MRSTSTRSAWRTLRDIDGSACSGAAARFAVKKRRMPSARTQLTIKVHLLSRWIVAVEQRLLSFSSSANFRLSINQFLVLEAVLFACSASFMLIGQVFYLASLSHPLIFCNRAANLKDLLAFLAEKLVRGCITTAQYVAAISVIPTRPKTRWPTDAFRHQKVSTRSTSMDNCAASFGVVHLEFNHPRSSSVTPRALPQSPH